MEWLVLIVGFILGVGAGVIVTSLIAARHIDETKTELTRIWSNIAMQITEESDKSINVGEWLSKESGNKEDKNE